MSPAALVRARPPQTLTGRRVVVVGGGLGGLAVAIRLAASGARVTVCERGASFGGKMNRWAPDGFRFDTGPSLITMPWVFADTFAAGGARLEDYAELVRVEPLAEYHFADGTRFRYTSSMPGWLETIRRIEPRDVDGFWRFLALGARLFEVSRHAFFDRSPWTMPDAGVVRALRHLPVRHGWGNYHRTVAAHFRSPILQQLFDRYPTYVGSSPYHAPATLAVIPYIEHVFGGWYARGGLYRIVEGLLAVAEALDVELLASTPVTRIEHARRRVTAVVAGHRRLDADIVVVNADASTVPGLLDEGGTATLPDRDRSLSGVVLLLALRERCPDLAHHAVFFSSDYAREFDDLFTHRTFPGEPTVYVNVPSRIDRSAVPAGGGDTVFVMANAPALGSAWTDQDTAEAERRIWGQLARGGFPDVTPHVVARDVWTPARFERCSGAPGGAIYGTHSHGWRRAFFRPPNRHPRVRGLYQVGGSTHPGGGTPTVLMSARITAALVEKDR
jgi:phytoene desaturase